MNPPPITAQPLPENALLAAYRERGYTDTWCAELPHAVSLAAFIAAFYTTPLFKVERAILSLLARRPSRDADAFALAGGASERFAAWRVEARHENEILLREDTGRTRSWLKVEALPGGGTRLLFGSAVLARGTRADGSPVLGPVFHALLGFHRVYARALLRAACSRLSANAG